MQDALIPQLSLGEKVRNFRKRAGLSQLELETEISAATGSISRIEAGKVNPTKETLLAICSTLKLSPTERLYLLDTEYAQVMKEDVEKTISVLEDVLEGDDLLGYVIDDKYNIIAISKNFKHFLSALGVNIEALIGKNMIEIVFDPNLGVRDIIDKDNFEFVAINLLSFFNQELNYRLDEQWWQDLYKRATSFPNFSELWEKTKLRNINGYAPISRSIKFNLKGTIMNTSYSLTAVHFDPRFTVTEYVIYP